MFFKRKISQLQKTELGDKPLQFPEGLAVRSEDSIWFIKNSKRFRFFSERCFESWGLHAIEGKPVNLSRIPKAGVLGFRDGTLIMNFADGKIYLISGSKRRQVMSRDVLTLYGLDDRFILEVSDAEANIHEDGEPLE